MIKKNLLFIKGAAISLAYKVKDSSPLPWLFLGQVAALSLGIAGLVIGVKTSNEFKEGNSSNLDYLKFFINKQELDNVSFVRSLDYQSGLISDDLKGIKEAVKALETEKIAEELSDIKNDVKGVAADVNTLTTNLDDVSDAIASTKHAVEGFEDRLNVIEKTVTGWNLYMSSKLNEVKEELSNVIDGKYDQIKQYIDENSKAMVKKINEFTEWSNLVVTDEIREDTETRLNWWFNAFILDLQNNWTLEITQ